MDLALVEPDADDVARLQAAGVADVAKLAAIDDVGELSARTAISLERLTRLRDRARDLLHRTLEDAGITSIEAMAAIDVSAVAAKTGIATEALARFRDSALKHLHQTLAEAGITTVEALAALDVDQVGARTGLALGTLATFRDRARRDLLARAGMRTLEDLAGVEDVEALAFKASVPLSDVERDVSAARAELESRIEKAGVRSLSDLAHVDVARVAAFAHVDEAWLARAKQRAAERIREAFAREGITTPQQMADVQDVSAVSRATGIDAVDVLAYRDAAREDLLRAAPGRVLLRDASARASYASSDWRVDNLPIVTVPPEGDADAALAILREDGVVLKAGEPFAWVRVRSETRKRVPIYKEAVSPSGSKSEERVRVQAIRERRDEGDAGFFGRFLKRK